MSKKTLPMLPVAENENSTNNKIKMKLPHNVDNVLENFKNEILQAIRQDVMQNSRRNIAHNNEDVSSTNDGKSYNNSYFSLSFS